MDSLPPPPLTTGLLQGGGISNTWQQWLTRLHAAASSSSGGSSGGYGAFSARPAAGTAGKTYIASDAPVAQWVDDGSAWHPLVLGQVVGAQPPAAASFSGFNSSGAAIADRNGALYVTGPDDGSGSSVLRAFVQTITTLAAATVELAIAHGNDWMTGGAEEWPVSGVVFLESATGKAVVLTITPYAVGGPQTGGAFALEAEHWASTTSRDADTAFEVLAVNQPIFIRIRSNSTSLFCEWSSDRQNWNLLTTFNIGSSFTTAPDRMGISIQGRGNTPKFNVLSYASQG